MTFCQAIHPSSIPPAIQALVTLATSILFIHREVVNYALQMMIKDTTASRKDLKEYLLRKACTSAVVTVNGPPTLTTQKE